MQALILAAGRGERMDELTKNTPKPLLKIANTTLIEQNITKLHNANIFDIIVNTYYLGDKIVKHLKKYDIKFSQEQKKLESGGGIINALPLLKNDKFIIINADVVSDYDLSKLILPHHSLAHLVLVDNPQHNQTGDFEFNHQKLTFSGIGIYHKKLFNHYPNNYLKLSTILFDNLANISFEHFKGKWLDVGTSQRLKIANQFIKF